MGLAVAEEAAPGAVIGKSGEPNGRVGTLFDRSSCVRAAHVGPHPPRADRVDEDVLVLELRGEDSGQCVQPCFGNPVGGRVAAHVRELPHPARDIDDAAIAVSAHERERRLRQPPSSEEIRLEHLADLV